MARRRDTSTLDIFSDWAPPQVAVAPAPEDVRGPMDLVIARLIKRALEGRDRSEIAAALSEVLGRTVSLSTLDAWASPAKTSNRIPLDAFAALIEVTDDMSLLGWLPEQHGYVVVPAKYADLIELHLLEEREAEIARRKAALTARYKGGGR
ncbi:MULTISPECIES: hypothetical protein [unclassified Xanthobacter]|uniref:hypothetical protein n=1 Tax=unclassified Xanthobacter TaxID=2623496 RepID=UPI001EDFDAF9|nr:MULTISPECIES: hypothetical protein [unclassified Xanthobacter]